METAAITSHCTFANLPMLTESVTELDLDFPEAEGEDWPGNNGLEQGVKLGGEVFQWNNRSYRCSGNSSDVFKISATKLTPQKKVDAKLSMQNRWSQSVSSWERGGEGDKGGQVSTGPLKMLKLRLKGR